MVKVAEFINGDNPVYVSPKNGKTYLTIENGVMKKFWYLTEPITHYQAIQYIVNFPNDPKNKGRMHDLRILPVDLNYITRTESGRVKYILSPVGTFPFSATALKDKAFFIHNILVDVKNSEDFF